MPSRFSGSQQDWLLDAAFEWHFYKLFLLSCIGKGVIQYFVIVFSILTRQELTGFELARTKMFVSWKKKGKFIHFDKIHFHKQSTN